jgi:FtsH-binding integral membrane protein
VNYMQPNPYAATYDADTMMAAWASEDARVGFIRRTYLHLAGAIGLFALLEGMIFTLVPAETLENLMGSLLSFRYSWLIVMAGFVGVSWLANSWATSATSQAMQYAGLLLYVLAETVIFVPLLFIANQVAPGAIGSAGLLTLIIFGGLTAIVMVTRTDLTSWGKYLWFGGLAALGLVVAAVVFNFSLGVWFSGAMIALSGAYILYDTSNVLHNYRTNQHVAAALALFASVALMFWYILRLFIALRDR